jgi:hypothetical protein
MFAKSKPLAAREKAAQELGQTFFAVNKGSRHQEGSS